MRILFKKKVKDNASPVIDGSSKKSALNSLDIEKIIQKVVGVVDSKRDKLFSGIEAVKQREGLIKENLNKLDIGNFNFYWTLVF